MQKSFFQSAYWAEFQNRYGWKPLNVNGLLAFEQLSYGTHKFLYLPDLEFASDELTQVKTQMMQSLSQLDYDFTKIEINNPVSLRYTTMLDGLGFVRGIDLSYSSIRQIIPLNIEEDAIYNQLHPETQKDIAKIDKTIEISLSQNPQKADFDADIMQKLIALNQFNYSLYQWSKQQFFDFIKFIYENKLGFSIFAKKDGYIICQLICVIFQNESYLFAFAINKPEQNTNILNYAQWQALLELKDRGSMEYQLIFDPKKFNEQKHFFAKQFEFAFGGQNIQSVGTYDLPISMTGYNQYKLSKQIKKSFSSKKISNIFKPVIKAIDTFNQSN